MWGVTYQEFTKQNKIRLNVFGFHLYSDTYRLKTVLHFFCPSLELFESQI